MQKFCDGFPGLLDNAEKSGGAGDGDVDEPMEQNGNLDTMKASNDEIVLDLVCSFR